MRGAAETSSQPSATEPFIQVSRPLTIPPSPSLKMTIRSKYSHCMISLLSAFSLAHGPERTCVSSGLCEVIGEPGSRGLASRSVEAELAVVEPAREVTDEAVLVLHVRADVLGNETLLGPGELGLQGCGAIQKRLDVALRIEEETGAAVRRNRAELFEELEDIPRVRLAEPRAREVLEHPLALRGHLHHDGRRHRHHDVRRRHQREPPPEAVADHRCLAEPPDEGNRGLHLIAHRRANWCRVVPVPAQVDRQCGDSFLRGGRAPPRAPVPRTSRSRGTPRRRREANLAQRGSREWHGRPERSGRSPAESPSQPSFAFASRAARRAFISFCFCHRAVTSWTIAATPASSPLSARTRTTLNSMEIREPSFRMAGTASGSRPYFVTPLAMTLSQPSQCLCLWRSGTIRSSDCPSASFAM